MRLTVEATLGDMGTALFSVRRVLFDPWQMQSTAQRLTRRGIPIQEFPQVAGNLTAASDCICFELVRGHNLVMYPFEDLRIAVGHAVAVETSRGWRIAKEKASHKIDAVVALAMACHAVVNLREPEVIPFVAPGSYRNLPAVYRRIGCVFPTNAPRFRALAHLNGRLPGRAAAGAETAPLH